MTDIKWGPAIAVDGKRPGLVKPADLVRWSNNGKPFVEVTACRIINWGDYDNRVSIRLPADHPHYRQTEEAPIDWSGELEAVHEDVLVPHAP